MFIFRVLLGDELSSLSPMLGLPRSFRLKNVLVISTLGEVETSKLTNLTQGATVIG